MLSSSTRMLFDLSVSNAICFWAVLITITPFEWWTRLDAKK
jgi:hypothetical protein